MTGLLITLAPQLLPSVNTNVISLCPVHQIRSIPEHVNTDLLINTHSFQEMSPEQVSHYATFINHITPNKVLSINRAKDINYVTTCPSSVLEETLASKYTKKSLKIDQFTFDIFTLR